MTNMRPWKVHVAVEGRQGPALVLPVDLPSPEEALRHTKDLMREVVLLTEQPGGGQYTVSVFPSGYRAGDRSLVAEKVTYATMRRSPTPPTPQP